MFKKSGLTDIAAAGTDVVMKDATWKIKSLSLKAPTGNTGAVYVGEEGVTSATGYPLYPGEEITYNYGDGQEELNKVWVDAATSGNDIAWTGLFLP